MSTKRSASSLLLAVTFVLAACAPAATPTREYDVPGTEAPYEYNEVAPEATQEAPNQLPSFKVPATAAPAGDMFFQDYGTNPAVDTQEDRLSTFSLDVDTGSYTVARRYVNDGSLPPREAVRVEEFVNYFDQGYPSPDAHHAFGINIDGASTPFRRSGGYQMMRVGIQGYTVPRSQRKDVTLTFVIDVSGSMDMENRLELVKRSLELLVEQLTDRDRVSIVVFGSSARVVLEPTPGNRQGTILEAIHSLHPEGATNAEAGLRLGYGMAFEALNAESNNRVILCSDGVANVGNTGAGSIWEQIGSAAKERGITLATIGFGMGNYNDELMEQLADHGDGFYAYVDDIDEARRLFLDKLTGTLQAIALDAKVQVDFNPDVVAHYRLVGYENRAVADDQFRDNSVDAGEIGAGHSATALYEIRLRPGSSGRIATVSMRWKDPDTREVVEISREYDTGQVAGSFEQAPSRFQLAVIVAEYAEVLRQSEWALNVSLDHVLFQAERVQESLWDDPDVREFVDLLRRASRMRGE